MARKITKKSFLRMSPSDIGKMNAPEIRELLRGVRNLYNEQAKVFERYSDKVYSPAYDKMRQYYDVHGTERVRKKQGVEYYTSVPRATTGMNINEMRSELFHLQDFFEAKTSTVPGARKVSSDMARRIFGEDKRGRPKNNFNTDEWTDFWSIYNEYKNQRPADVFEQSELVQQVLGQMIKSDFTNFTFIGPFLRSEIIERLRNMVSQRRETENWEMSEDDGDTVFSGTRPY